MVVTNEMEVARINLQNEINKHKVSIDRSVFAKTAEEKLALKKAKKEINSKSKK